MSKQWSDLALAIQGVLTSTGTFQNPLDSELKNLTLGEWQLAVATKIAETTAAYAESEYSKLRGDLDAAEREIQRLNEDCLHYRNRCAELENALASLLESELLEHNGEELSDEEGEVSPDGV